MYLPYLTPCHGPAWLKQYLQRPHDRKLLNKFILDVCSGLTVAITLIPQGLSYATLTRMPPVSGLYSVILPGILYLLFGTCMQLGVGPVALVSLLVGSLMEKYKVDYEADSAAAMNFAAQVCICNGGVMMILGFCNMGNVISLISHPVMSAFTNAAALTIALNQVNSACGFPAHVVPQVGAVGGVHYNYEVLIWYANHWTDVDSTGNALINPYAVAISVVSLLSLLVMSFLRQKLGGRGEASGCSPSGKYTTKSGGSEAKSALWLRVFQTISTGFPVIVIMIAAKTAFVLHSTASSARSHHAKSLQLIGAVPSGLNILRVPNSFQHPWIPLAFDTLPITLVSYMESISVATNIAKTTGHISLLNPCQELIALGLGNMFNAFASGFPVSGSFSRSALYAQTGATSLMASAVTLVVVVISLTSLTSTFYYIPKAVLAAVIFMAVLNLVDFAEFYRVWQVSKKDSFVMCLTFLASFFLNTEIGLCWGIGLSVVFLLRDYAFSPSSQPSRYTIDAKEVQLEVVRFNCNLVFISSARIREFVTQFIDNECANGGRGVEGVVLDLVDVKHIDTAGVFAMKDVFSQARRKKVLVFVSNALPHVLKTLLSAGVVGDRIPPKRKDMAMALLAEGFHICREPVPSCRGGLYVSWNGVDEYGGYRALACTYCSEELEEYDISRYDHDGWISCIDDAALLSREDSEYDDCKRQV